MDGLGRRGSHISKQTTLGEETVFCCLEGFTPLDQDFGEQNATTR